MKRNQNRLQVRRLKLKPMDYFILSGVIVSIIVLVLGLGSYVENAKKNQLSLIEEIMDSEAHNLKLQFEELLEDKVKVLQALASYPEIYEMDELKQLRMIKQKAYRFGFYHIFVMNKDGVGFYIDENVHRDQGEEAFFQDVMNNDVFITAPFYSGNNQVFTTLCVSIMNQDSEKVGSLCGALKLNYIHEMIEENDMILDGKCFILDGDGKYLTSENMADVVHQISIYEQADTDASLIKAAIEEQTDKKGRVTVEGVEYQCNVTYLKEFNWVIVQIIPIEKIVGRFSTLNTIQGFLIICCILLVVCMIRIIYHWYKNINKIYTDALTNGNSSAACLDLLDNIEKKRNCRISLVFMDLNRFKYVNDTYGHKKGDEMLCIFSKALEDTFGELGFVGRLGGDEFVSVLRNVPDSDIEDAWKKLEVILLEKSKEMNLDGYVITSSYGYASREKHEKETIESLRHKADERMYLYKDEFKRRMNIADGQRL